MPDNETALPEGTDKVIVGASNEAPSADLSGDGVAHVNTTLVQEREIPAPAGDAERPTTGSGSAENGLGSGAGSPSSNSGGGTAAGIADRLRSSGERLTGQVTDHARGLVGQGLERSAEALSSVSRTIGDTAQGIDDRLGSEYGDYARRAASAIDSAANGLASKDPDELIDDARTFIRNSPGIALAGAAVVGFVVARLVKSGISSGSSSGTSRNETDRE